MRETGGGRSRNYVKTVLMYKILKKFKEKRSIDFMINNIWTLIKTSV